MDERYHNSKTRVGFAEDTVDLDPEPGSGAASPINRFDYVNVALCSLPTSFLPRCPQRRPREHHLGALQFPGWQLLPLRSSV
jgi:hypothetical protein